jgi:hypothetical protein|tara:strand:+ start:7182 stop:7358 length:177 start_codon:yes stop_codon:yes gene_type:complete
MIEKLNKYLDGKRKHLLVTLNMALLIFVILEFSLLFSISPPRGYVERDCSLSNVGTCH